MDKAKELATRFEKIDANGNGKLEYAELQKVFGEHAEEFLKFCDEGQKDGVLTVDEFCNGIIADVTDSHMTEEDFQTNWLNRMDEVIAAAATDTPAAANDTPDTHVSVCPYFSVPEGKMDEFKAGFSEFYTHTSEGTKAAGSCLYYGFTSEGDTVFCREGYANADAVLAHLGEVKPELDAAVGMVGDGLKLAVMGPAAEVEKLKEPLTPLGCKFWELDGGAMFFGAPSATAVTIAPYFTVPEGKMDEFKAAFPTFYEHVKAGTGASGQCFFYGFAVCEGQVHCRESYANADGVLAHLGEVKTELDAAVAMVGEGGLNLAVMGPAEELEKLKEALTPLGCQFFALDAAAL